MSGSNGSFEGVVVGLLKDSSLMGTFNLPAPLHYVASYRVYVILLVITESTVPIKYSSIGENTGSSHLASFNLPCAGKDPWIVPYPFALVSGTGYIGSGMPWTTV